MALPITRSIGAAAGARGTTRIVLWGAGLWLALLVAPELLAATIAHAIGPSPLPRPQGVDAGFAPAVRDSAGSHQASAAPASAAAEESAEAPPLLDTGVLAAIFGADPGTMRKFAFMFLDSARAGLAEVDIALASNLARAGAVVHRLKSSARAVGAMRFGELCDVLERQHGRGGQAQAKALGARLRSMFARLERQVAADLGARATDGP